MRHYVDLGLSVLWADCNIGANTPEESGNYYKCSEIPNEYEIPTKQQYEELIKNCTWKWTTQNGVKGCKVTSNKNGNSIFLPAASCLFEGSDLCEVGNEGFYWSSSLSPNNSSSAYYIGFCSGYVDWFCYYHYYKQSVRPIKKQTLKI